MMTNMELMLSLRKHFFEALDSRYIYIPADDVAEEVKNLYREAEEKMLGEYSVTQNNPDKSRSSAESSATPLQPADDSLAG